MPEEKMSHDLGKLTAQPNVMREEGYNALMGSSRDKKSRFHDYM